MEKEISSGAMLGIVLIALAAIIGLGFGVFAIAKGTANEGVTKVQDNLGAVSDSEYSDYDQKIVTGTQVVSAYNNFEGKNAAVLVMTQALKDKAVDSEDTVYGGNGIDSAYEQAGVDFKSFLIEAFIKDTTVSGSTTAYTNYPGVVDSKNKAVANPVFVNYNALLGADASTDGPTTKNYTSEKWIYFDSNCWRTTTAFEATAGKVKFNNIYGNMNKSGMMEYVTSGARFQAYLIKDVSGTNMGVAFEQIGQ